MQKWTLITGSTSGIRRATASLLAKNKMPLILTGRGSKKLQEIKDQ